MGTTSKSSFDKDSVRIAGAKTRKNWKDRAEEIAAAQRDNDEGELQTLFKRAAEEFLRTRINTRYLHPIKVIERDSSENGEGFAIVALICSLIEFLQTLRDGTVFDNSRSSMDANKSAQSAICRLFCDGIFSSNRRVSPRKSYADIIASESGRYGQGYSQDIFVRFLRESSGMNFGKKRANDFYSKVRCAILHNAMVEEPWVIKVHSTCDSSVHQRDLVKDEGGRIILYRDELVRRLQQYIDQYCQDLLTDQALQAAFIRKFDSL